LRHEVAAWAAIFVTATTGVAIFDSANSLPQQFLRVLIVKFHVIRRLMAGGTGLAEICNL
jgi:hypothetical protein